MTKKLDPTKIYYLAHPATSCGDYWENRRSEHQAAYQIAIRTGYGARKKPLRPLTMIHPDTKETYDQIMKRCFKWLSGCDVIILCGDWENSKGCKMEKEYAELLGLEVLTYEEVVG